MKRSQSSFFTPTIQVGKRFSFDNEKPGEIEIVGLVRDAKYTSQRDDIPATVYETWTQVLDFMRSATFEVRTSGDPKALVAGIREAVRQVEPNLPVSNIKTQIEQVDESLSMERMFAKLLTLFGLVAQTLAAIGLYGVMAYSVSQRTQEIGIRMALGANRANVLRMMLRQGMILTVIGVAIGLIAAFVLTKYLDSLTTYVVWCAAKRSVHIRCYWRVTCAGCVSCVFDSRATRNESRSVGSAAVRVRDLKFQIFQISNRR
jgi:hypothetical protein